MSLVGTKRTLTTKQLKYLFLASYFELENYDCFVSDVAPFVGEYLRNRFDELDDQVLLKFVDYLVAINLKNLIADRSVDVFRYCKPQFKYVCNRDRLDILDFSDKVYIQPGTPIYATNFFVKDPNSFRVLLYSEFSKIFDKRLFVSSGETHCLINGDAGYVFDSAYLDWCGVRMCSAPKVRQSEYPHRLYLVGEAMARHFIENNISMPTNMKDYKLKNFYKGLPLFKSNYRVINSKTFITSKPDKVFEEIGSELNATHVKFIQRDYIYDAAFPDDLLDLLNEYMTETALFKFIQKNQTPVGDVETAQNQGNFYSEIVVDRYAVDRYRKLNVRIHESTRYPSLRYNEPAYVFVRENFIQVKGTLNAFFIPNLRTYGILANNSLFGSNELIHFDLGLINYAQSAAPISVAAETYVVDRAAKLYLMKTTYDNVVPAYLLIRGDYESSFRSLHELKNTWVQNTILRLLISPEILDKSLKLDNGRSARAQHQFSR